MNFDAINQEKIITYITEYGVNVLGGIVIFFVGKWLAKLATRLVSKFLYKAKIDKTLISFLENIVYALLLAFVIIAVLDRLGVDTTSIAAIFAAAGLAIGLALQGSLSNLAAGVMIILFRPFKLGDFIEAAGVIGTVKDISIFTTTLTTGDNKTVIVPNNSITDGTITNYSAQKTRRVDMVFGISYDDDVRKAKEILQKIVEEDERILDDPAPLVAVGELADSSVNFKVRPWVKTEDYWDVYHDIHEKVKVTFDKKGITIPYPQQDIYMHTVEGTTTKKVT